MRRPRFRVTVRRMMVAVSVSGIVMAGIALKRRRDTFLSMASEYAEREADWLASEKMFRDVAAGSRRMATMGRDSARFTREHRPRPGERIVTPEQREAEARDDEAFARTQDDDAEKSEKNADKYRGWAADDAAMKARCERAARYPWLPVAPAPSVPE